MRIFVFLEYAQPFAMIYAYLLYVGNLLVLYMHIPFIIPYRPFSIVHVHLNMVRNNETGTISV